MVIPNAILLSQTLFLCECEIVVPVIKLQMEGARQSISSTIPQLFLTKLNYSTTILQHSTILLFRAIPNQTQVAAGINLYSLVAIRWFTLILSVDLPKFGP